MSEKKPSLIVVLGPTASGKSSLGITLALHLRGEIVSADSRQVYRGLDIGTAKVTQEEQAQVTHHLLDVVAPDDIYTVSQFQRAAFSAIDGILARHHQPLLVGGSPHYIQVVVDNLDIPRVAPQPQLRIQLAQRPLSDLLEELHARDPKSFAAIDQSNLRRVIRALEVCISTGQPFSEQRGRANPLYNSLLLGIQWARDVLHKRIDARVDERMQEGMVREVQGLLDTGVSHERLEALGLEYRFVARWLRGEFSSEELMVERLKYAIHDFTRRQLSWFRRDPRIVWLDGTRATQEAVPLVEDFLKRDENS